MTEATMTERVWRLDTVEAPPATSELSADAQRPARPTAEPLVSPSGPAPVESMPAGFWRRWSQAMQDWATESIRRVGNRGARFESLLHELSTIIESSDDLATVEAALLRQARRLVPGCRIELITGGSSSADQEDECGGDLVEAASRGCARGPGAGDNHRSVAEIPLRCGSTVRGRLRIRSRTRAVTSLSKDTVRRLAMLCAMGACALDALSRSRDWPWDEDVAHLTSSPAGGPARSASPGDSIALRAVVLHDATFLNAVLPFALNQARRHREPISVVCIAIDRLGGIQELLGRGAAELLVKKVGETVAALIRVSDVVARLDDDRVVAVLPRAPGGGAFNVAQKICRTVREQSLAACEIPSISVSIGVATFPSCADNVFSLFDAADDALGQSQKLGRNQAVLAPPRTAVAMNQSRAFSTPS
jgi:diguanylate cyclase (GGDEF)-like protein